MSRTVAEFFCGCGGFSRGFTMSGKFDVVFGNDVKNEALKTFEFNHQKDAIVPRTISGDIREISLARIGKELKEYGVRSGDLDCLIGGPPCQGFSQLRRTEERSDGKIVKFRGYSKLAHDSRNDLVLRFLEIAEFLQPKFVVIENVPQMLNHGYQGRLGRLSETVVEVLEEMGYSVAVSILTAADYGVPQLRERALFIASSIAPATFPTATHANPSTRTLDKKNLPAWTTVRDALEDLPEPSFGQDSLGGKEITLYRPTRSLYAQHLQSRASFPYNHVSRLYNDSVVKIIKEMRPGEVWDAASARMQALYETRIKEHARTRKISYLRARRELTRAGVINEVFYKRYYWSAYTRLSWDDPALTITANANFLGSGRFTHPNALRGITMREAARLQSFDDNFKFITSGTNEKDTARIGIGMDMIGEAVPPLMAKAIAVHLAEALDRNEDQSSKIQ